ncbi:MAG: thioredoxin fold domain-containing protein [Lentisphaeria bacterium]|nr:thioredoxin fold domain-containing protein [Lentisphaeria bacterium]
MKKLIIALAVLFGTLSMLCANPPDGGWFTDAKAALAEAKAKNLPVFAYFTGSDWCPVCKEFSAKVLQTQRFRDFVKGKVILLFLDFPQEHELPAALALQNEQWQAKYQVEGFPTMLLVDAEGNELDRLGYSRQADFIDMLKQALNPMKEEDYKPAAGWMVNYDKALTLAAEKKLPVVMVFTASDWSPEDAKFKTGTLESKALQEFAAGKAVLLCIDFPRSSRIPRTIAKQNTGLIRKYNFTDLPVTFVLNPKGDKLGEITGAKDAAAYIAALKAVIDKK